MASALFESGVRTIAGGMGLILVVIALAIDLVGLGESGVGPTQIVALLVGAVFLILAWATPRWVSATLVARIILLSVSSYGILVLGDVALTLLQPDMKKKSEGLHGLFIADPEIGYRLAPNWAGSFDDGITNVEYRINSLGHRDEEYVESNAPRRILLIGDSFAFGYRLAQSATIDRQLEQMSDGRIDVCNIGVQGYGPPAILESLRRADWFEGSDVLYLFFNNDLRSDNLLLDMGLTAFDGYLVSKYRPDSTVYSDEEHRKQIEEHLNPPKPGLGLLKAAKLEHIRSALISDRATYRNPLDIQGPGVFLPENISKAVRTTLAMRDLASERNMKFHVFLGPTRGEVLQGAYAPLVQDYAERLDANGVHPVELLDVIDESHYFPPPDIHLTPEGARQVSHAMLKALEPRALGSPSGREARD
jgi:hypothetical protein